MRVLYVTHLYPPVHSAGVEVFASTTARLLADRGHDVTVLTTEKDIARADLSLHRRRHDGLQVVELVNNLFARRFEETWQRPEIDRIFEDVLDELQPELVHVHHLLYLSSGILGICRRRGLPVVLTLHDFWLGCARFGQLLHADGSRCESVDPARCGSCLPSLDWRQSDTARRVARGVAALARTTGLDVAGPLRRLRKPSGGEGGFEEPALADVEAFTALAGARREDLVDAVNESASRVLLPAAFMRPWFEALGLRPELLHVETTGVDWEGARRFERERRPSGAPVRVLFLGTLAPHKGAHVLVDAWERLPADVRSRARLRLHGPAPGGTSSAYVRELEERGAPLGLTVGGRLSRDGVRREMARTDVLVTPSLWLEIRPLVMLEAYAAGARVIATDLGGMAEAVHDGLPGRLFPEGDAAALSDALAAEIERAEREGDVAPLPSPSALFRAWNDVSAALDGHYADVVDRGRGSDPLRSR